MRSENDDCAIVDEDRLRLVFGSTNQINFQKLVA